MEVKDFETSSVTADSSTDSESDLTCVTETQYEISADNLLKPDEAGSDTDTTMPEDKPYWYNDKCFARYWKHYNRVMSWYKKHLYVYKSMQRQFYPETFVVRPYRHQQENHSLKKHTDSCSKRKKRRRHHHSKSKRLNENKEIPQVKTESQFAHDSRPLDEPMSGTEAGGEDPLDQEEYQMEITDDMLQFFATSQQHRKERDANYEKIDGIPVTKRVNIEDVHKQMPTVEAPKERPGVRRTAEMKLLYGKGAAMIHGMETALQMTYDRNMDVKQPKVWPNIPLRITFAD